jgi:hypothetical protein
LLFNLSRLRPLKHEATPELTTQLPKIEPGLVHEIVLDVEVDGSAEPYEELHWSVNLLLNDRLIEIGSNVVRIAETYESQRGDVLLITGIYTSRQEYLQWKKAITGLDLSFDVWDLTYNCGISRDERTEVRHSNSFLGHYQQKLIIFPVHSLKYYKLFRGVDQYVISFFLILISNIHPIDRFEILFFF